MYTCSDVQVFFISWFTESETPSNEIAKLACSLDANVKRLSIIVAQSSFSKEELLVCPDGYPSCDRQEAGRPGRIHHLDALDSSLAGGGCAPGLLLPTELSIINKAAGATVLPLASTRRNELCKCQGSGQLPTLPAPPAYCQANISPWSIT